jgi:predicted DCC family thiol-disulfide oxidoreductase YuxK
VSVWDRLFAPANARVLGVARAGVGVAALMELAATAPRMASVAAPDGLRLPMLGPVASVVYGAWPVVAAIWLVAGLAFVVGWRTPLSGGVLALVFIGVVAADQQLYSNHSYLIALAVTLLTLGGAGRSWSLDARRHGTDAEPAPAWALLGIRTQVSVMYAFAVLAKLNASFLSGSVVAASLRRDGFAVPVDWQTFELMFVLSIVVIACEAFLAVGLWLPRWRPAAFIIGLALHVGIVVLMQSAWDLAVFTVVTLSLYVAYVDAPRATLNVVWDDGCGFCGAWVRWFRRLDWLDVLRFVPRSALALSALPVSEAGAAEALHLVEPSRTTCAFAAVRRIAAHLPISFLWEPLLAIPPIPSVGERVYRRVAARRSCPLNVASAVAPLPAVERTST